MAVHASRLLFLLPALVVLLHATAPAAAAATSCTPRACGNLTIAYPFWLPDQQASVSPSPQPPCGPAAFQVSCTGGVASLAQSFLGAYKILRISYANRTVVIANANVQTDAAGCPAPRIDVSASLSLAPFTASAANAQLIFLFNCTGTGGGASPAAAGFVNVTCPGEQAVVRLDPRYNTSAARAIAGGCTYSVVPVVGFTGAIAGEYPKLLRGGYMLEWRAAAGDCAACNASGGRCGYDADADAFACICSDGSSRPARCGMF
ncbi:unnamed protein product [Urochloa humidicola]